MREYWIRAKVDKDGFMVPDTIEPTDPPFRTPDPEPAAHVVTQEDTNAIDFLLWDSGVRVDMLPTHPKFGA